ncbi:MAG TPA: nucleotide sugar dehydrogenase [Candidatus Andersenbacteria bacterium]|nr:nucleotide sugar dehydrogenase [Candidatus Andersenbacteria bacterium]
MRVVAIVGLGYVGLPLAVLARAKGWQAIGYDINAEKVAQINQGVNPLADPELSEQLKHYPIEATTDPARVAAAEIIIVAVPTPVTAANEPDLHPLEQALQNILPHLVTDQTIVVESTINPGVMDEVVRPLLEERRDITLHIAHCPERINPADPKWTVRNIPRVLGAYTAEGTARARAFYESVLEAPVKIMGSPTEAEAVKILENTFRDVNIAFINEMAKSFAALNINILNVIEGAATKPFAFMPHYPGNGVGGHCISVDPYYMIARARQAGFDHEFLKLARQINDSMPAYTIELLEQALAQHGLSLETATIALLGVAYKKNVGDTRRSPALTAMRLLEKRGAAVRVFDPLVPAKSTVASLAEALVGSTAVLLACDHDELTAALTPATLAAASIKIVIDGKNALNAEDIARHGITYYGIGQRTAQTEPVAKQI